MSKITTATELLLHHPGDISRAIDAHTSRWKICRLLSDEAFLKLRFFLCIHKHLSLKNPVTFNEKLQWLKIHDRDPLYNTLVDKIAVKQYIVDHIGQEYIIPTLGIWDKTEEIDFNSLPDQFVLKCTHDTGSVIVCRDRNKFDTTAARIKLNEALKEHAYWFGREWPYKDVKPRIIAEKYMTDGENDTELTDYKFYCFNGNMECVMVCYDRGSGDTKFYFFDHEWNLLRINKRGREAPEDFTLPKPKNFEKMIQLAERLSKDILFVRVDFYNCNGNIYFGEMTFYPQSGFDPNYLPETDRYFGSLIDLSIVRERMKVREKA